MKQTVFVLLLMVFSFGTTARAAITWDCKLDVYGFTTTWVAITSNNFTLPRPSSNYTDFTITVGSDSWELSYSYNELGKSKFILDPQTEENITVED